MNPPSLPSVVRWYAPQTKPDERDEWSHSMAPDGRKHRPVRVKRQAFFLRAVSPTQNLHLYFFPAPGLSQARPGPGMSANKNKSIRAGKIAYFFHNMLFRLRKTSIYVCQFFVRPPAEPGTSTVKLGRTKIKCISPTRNASFFWMLEIGG